MDRLVTPELLDHLPAKDPRAVRSRRDLQRLNRLMTSAEILSGILETTLPSGGARHIVELGAGDGSLLLSIAQRLPRQWSGTEVLLLDKQDLLQPETAQAYDRLGWKVTAHQADLLEWVHEPLAGAPEIILANLFLHHFADDQLADLLPRLAARTRVFIAFEPRRSRLFLMVAHLLWLVGCNGVTRHDAKASVRAGFTGRELSQLWPEKEGWLIVERPAGRFSHLFFAANPNGLRR